jgi:four helix bundle protein
MRDFENLQAWMKSHQLTLKVYQETASFPEAEKYGLTSQRRRAAASIAANVAEGYGRDSDREFVRFLNIVAGSATELEYHILLASDLGYLTDEANQVLNGHLYEVQKMLAGLIRRIQSSLKRHH